jgi:hypothetical protein
VTLKNFPGGYTPGPPLKGEGGGKEGKRKGKGNEEEDREGEGREKGGEGGDGEGTGMGREGKEGRREETGTTSFRTLPPPLLLPVESYATLIIYVTRIRAYGRTDIHTHSGYHITALFADERGKNGVILSRWLSKPMLVQSALNLKSNQLMLVGMLLLYAYPTYHSMNVDDWRDQSSRFIQAHFLSSAIKP